MANAFVITQKTTSFELNIPFPVIAKPNFERFQIWDYTKKRGQYHRGIGRCHTPDTGEIRLRQAILVEEFLTGAEVSCRHYRQFGQLHGASIIEED